MVVDGKTVLGTAGLHKTPLTSLADDPEQLEQLAAWLASFRPEELFDADGRPQGTLAEALAHIRLDELCPEPTEFNAAVAVLERPNQPGPSRLR